MQPLALAWLAAVLSSPAQAAATDGPTATLRWRKDRASLQVEAGPGEHLAPEAPATLRLERGSAPPIEIACAGADLSQGLPLVAPDGAFTLTVDAVACEDGGSTCRPVHARFSGQRAGRRGQLALAVGVDNNAATHTPATGGSAELKALLEAARADGRPVLIDFSAQWCPPCNLLAAEILHDPANEADLAGFHLIEIDVDRPESWEAKDRYAVGGYPTLLAARPDGVEIDRLVGYPGEEAVLSWLAALPDQPALGALPAAADLPPDEAARIALRLGLAGRIDEGLPYLERAEASSSAALDPARLLLRGDSEAARRAVEQAGPAFPGDWLWSALALADDSPALARALQQRLPEWISRAPGPQAADLLYVAGELADPADAPIHFAAAAMLLSDSLSGDPARDRGHWTGLADLTAKAGLPAQALAVLDAAVAHYPAEFTFHHARAGLLLDQGRAEDAVEAARNAMRFAYGDNALRAADRLAQALLTSGKADAARAVVDQALQQAARPDPSARVRTGRYLAALEATRARIDAPPQAPELPPSP